MEMLAAEVALHHHHCHGDAAAAAAAKGPGSGNGFVEGGHKKEEGDEAPPPAGPAALTLQERTARIVITALACVAFLLLGGLGGIIGTCGWGVRGPFHRVWLLGLVVGDLFIHLDPAPTWTEPTISQTKPLTPPNRAIILHPCNPNPNNPPIFGELEATRAKAGECAHACAPPRQTL